MKNYQIFILLISMCQIMSVMPSGYRPLFDITTATSEILLDIDQDYLHELIQRNEIGFLKDINNFRDDEGNLPLQMKGNLQKILSASYCQITNDLLIKQKFLTMEQVDKVTEYVVLSEEFGGKKILKTKNDLRLFALVLEGEEIIYSGSQEKLAKYYNKCDEMHFECAITPYGQKENKYDDYFDSQHGIGTSDPITTRQLDYNGIEYDVAFYSNNSGNMLFALLGSYHYLPLVESFVCMEVFKKILPKIKKMDGRSKKLIQICLDMLYLQNPSVSAYTSDSLDYIEENIFNRNIDITLDNYLEIGGLPSDKVGNMIDTNHKFQDITNNKPQAVFYDVLGTYNKSLIRKYLEAGATINFVNFKNIVNNDKFLLSIFLEKSEYLSPLFNSLQKLLSKAMVEERVDKWKNKYGYLISEIEKFNSDAQILQHTLCKFLSILNNEETSVKTSSSKKATTVKKKRRRKRKGNNKLKANDSNKETLKNNAESEVVENIPQNEIEVINEPVKVTEERVNNQQKVVSKKSIKKSQSLAQLPTSSENNFDEFKIEVVTVDDNKILLIDDELNLEKKELKRKTLELIYNNEEYSDSSVESNKKLLRRNTERDLHARGRRMQKDFEELESYSKGSNPNKVLKTIRRLSESTKKTKSGLTVMTENGDLVGTHKNHGKNKSSIGPKITKFKKTFLKGSKK